MTRRGVGTSVETFTGRFLDFLGPQARDISLDDLAQGLSLHHRFAGQISRPYTVAEHAVFVRDLVVDWGHPELGMGALHHDSHEAYLGDWPSPLKVVVEQRAPGLFDELAGAIDAAVARRFNFDVNEMHHLVVKKADEFALRREAATLKYSHGCGSHWQYDEAFEPLAGIGWSDSRAVREFMRAHNQEIQRRASFS